MASTTTTVKVEELYPIAQMGAFYAWLQAHKQDLVCLNPLMGEKVQYKGGRQFKAGRSGGGGGGQEPIDIRVLELRLDFEAAWQQSDYPGATPIYYRLKRLLSY